ncbi:hypothetical protein EI427_01605 [Flammeovirga pectinis]|uniref:Uncharacterized protein n=1 Tax=Flammeovirga pectinis TaxID=2494373 RepID=A0A3Q9FKZ3_9BACT|nr:hypothetical protein [Flammeovirga pectinis]AZQ60954.1 hypothetical protein EI427_01605 [Flammeovirga pectinis]
MTTAKITLEEYLNNKKVKFLRIPRIFKDGSRVIGAMWEAIEGIEEFQEKGDPSQLFIRLYFDEQENSILMQETRFAMSMVFPVKVDGDLVTIDLLDFMSALRKFAQKLPVEREPIAEILEFILYSCYYGYDNKSAEILAKKISNAAYLNGKGETDEEGFHEIVNALYEPPKEFFVDKYVDGKILEIIEVQEQVYDNLPAVLWILRKHIVQDRS